MTHKTWLILDSNYLAHRAFHTTGDLSYNNVKTGVVYGFLRDIVTFTELHSTDKVVFCFDHKPYLREEHLVTYKNRPVREDLVETYDELHRQINLLRDEYLYECGFRNVFHKKGYESDDMIASAAHTVDLMGDKAVIVSSDHDLFQLLTPNVICWNPNLKLATTCESFKKKFGVTPEQWILVKALGGCRGDKVPGIRGIGESTACKFVRGLIKRDSKTFQNIVCPKGQTVMNRNLRIVTLPFYGTPEFRPKKDEVTVKKWKALCVSLGMKSLVNRFPVPNWID